jgi:hypothetical protein
LECELKMSHILCSLYLFFDMREKVWKGISLNYTIPEQTWERTQYSTELCQISTNTVLMLMRLTMALRVS